MTKQYVCDVCGEAYELSEPHIELVVPQDIDGPVPEGTWDACSWSCVSNLATQAQGLEVEDSEPEFIVTPSPSLPEPVQIAINDERPRYAKEVEDAGTGSYFPPGMRVDGRPAEHLRRVRVVPDE